MSGSRVALEVRDGVARLRLCAPGRRNAIDPAWVAEFAAAITEVQVDATVRAVLVHAEGTAFTVGGDLRHFVGASDLARALREMVPAFHDALHGLASVNAPVVAAVQGATAGGGLGIAWCSDIVIAADDAVFTTGFVRLALSGDGGSSWWLPRLVGLRRAQQMVLQDRIVRASEALEWGIVTEVVPAGELRARAEIVVAAFANGPTGALAQMRHLLRQASTRSLGDHLAAETEAIIACGRSSEAREGVASFVGGRAPDFVQRQRGDVHG